MTPFFPLYIRRSDGKIQAKPHGTSEPNEPTAEQLDQSPNAQGICDFYRICKSDDPKVLDWRRKLAGMLVRELAPKEPTDKNFILASLPENYRLYEHIKYKASSDSTQPQKAGKNHAAGANDRQDAYLYGHPSGRKKRYRSPNEFFPHLMWLASDEQGDPNNCSCKFCTPEELDTGDKNKTAKQTTTSAAESASDTKPKPPALSRPGDVLKQPPKERKPSNPQPLVQPQLGRVPFPQPAARSPSAKLEPTLLPRFRSMEQRLDSQHNKHLYRPGEIVWFKKGMAWGLGVVQSRGNTVQTTSPYRIQPLSHPFHHPSVLNLAQHELRPWLAWSPPPTVCAALRPEASNGFRIHTYDTVDWTAYMQGAYGPGDGEVDGSILAARQAETTYTPFDTISSNPIPNTPQPQGQETHWNGIFMGAEKIWVGDALRLRTGTFPTDIVVLHDIVEQPVMISGNSYLPPDAGRSKIILIGDTYTISVVELQPQFVPKDTLHLPSRVREDLAFKNALTSKKSELTQRYSSYWRLTQRGVRLGIEDVKGRWYESVMLLPILNPKTFADRHLTGDIPDACGYMNGQGDCNRPPFGTPGAELEKETGQTKSRPADVRKERREAAFGAAVPREFRVHRGLDEGKDVRSGTGQEVGASGAAADGRDWMDPNTGASSRPSTRPGSSSSALTGVGMASTPGTSTASLPGFGQEYSSQELQEGKDVRLFQDATDGLGDVSMGQG